jgi:hypothetical protein
MCRVWELMQHLHSCVKYTGMQDSHINRPTLARGFLPGRHMGGQHVPDSKLDPTSILRSGQLDLGLHPRAPLHCHGAACRVLMRAPRGSMRRRLARLDLSFMISYSAANPADSYQL